MQPQPERTSLLVVDDDECIRETMTDILEDVGFRVVTAANGRDALQLLHDGPAPFLILSDLVMPIMDGRAFCRHKNDDPAFKHIPVIIISGVADLEQAPETLCAAAFFTKPVNIPQLLAAIHRYA